MTSCKNYIFSSPHGNPEAHITLGRNRISVTSDRKVYLNDGTEFSLELFNPTTDIVLARIRMNGSMIGGDGIILRPGERVYLERYLDRNVKFRFSTYQVEDSPEAKAAIRKNGEVTVSFHREKLRIPAQTDSGTWIMRCHNLRSTASSTYNFTATSCDTSLTGPEGPVGPKGPECSVGVGTGAMMFSGALRTPVSQKVETGRIEEGAASAQQLINEQREFETTAICTVAYSLLPYSLCAAESSRVSPRQYCTQCGARIRKSTWQFCPQCGSRF